MFIELVDTLRCLAPHADTWLVATVERLEHRHIIEGRLGCPECRAEYPVRRGIADFTRGEQVVRAHEAAVPDESELLRAGALLDLRSEGGTIVLGGRWSGLAAALAGTYGVQALVVNPPDAWATAAGASALLVTHGLPIAEGSVRGVLLDACTSGSPLLASAVRALRSGGRLIAPADAPLPDDATELVRDDSCWVAERAAIPSPPITLTRAR